MPPRLITIGLVVALIAVATLALEAGALPITLSRIASALQRSWTSQPLDALDAQAIAVLFGYRLPRVVLAIAAGAGLACAGAVLQSVFRNPLADPMLIGVSSGAALAVTAVIVLGQTMLLGLARIAGPLTLPLAGFVGGLATTVLLYRLATKDGRTSLVTMLLGGIALNALALAAIGLLTTLATNEQLRSISFWNFGSLGGATWTLTTWLAIAVVLVSFALTRMGAGFDALLLGDAEARHLGFDTHRLKRDAIACAALLSGFVVAICGVIGFVALVAPHVVRLLCGPGHRALVPASALLGGLLLLAADLVARTIASPIELPIGIVTAFIGAPFFLWLLVRRHRQDG